MIYRLDSSGNINSSMLCSELDNVELVVFFRKVRILWKSGCKKCFSILFVENHFLSSQQHLWRMAWNIQCNMASWKIVWAILQTFEKSIETIAFKPISKGQNHRDKISDKHHYTTVNARWIKCWNGFWKGGQMPFWQYTVFLFCLVQQHLHQPFNT